MIKIIHNNLVIDLCREERYLKYLPQQNHYIEVKKYLANAILGSDGNTIYHIAGTPYNFNEELKSVVIIPIGEEEFNRLSKSVLITSQEAINLREEVNDLKELVKQQSLLLQELIKKI